MNYPFVSVVMPVRNESLYIVQSISAVLQQEYPKERLEILVADGDSDDNTVALIESLSESARIQIIGNPRKIQAAGLNKAIRAARGDVIVRVDGHTIIAPDYVRRCVEMLSMAHADNVGGSIHHVGRTVTGRAIALASRSLFAIPTAFRVSKKSRYVDTVYMGAWRRQVFEQVGFFDELFAVNEDYEFNFRTRKAGGRIYFSSEICSEYYGQETIQGLARQYLRYGKSKPKTLQKHPRSLRPRHLVAPVFTLFAIGGVPLSILLPQVAGWWIWGIGIYLMTNFAFSLYIGQREQLSLLLRVPWIFAVIHLAWGSGFWLAVLQMLMCMFKRS